MQFAIALENARIDLIDGGPGNTVTLPTNVAPLRPYAVGRRFQMHKAVAAV